MTLKDIADAINVVPAEIIVKAMSLNIVATINSSVDFDTCCLILLDYGIDVKKENTDTKPSEEIKKVENPKNLVKRPPIITVMGHVDHGKTTLLDQIRKTKVALSESGGITQAIAAYQVERNGEKLTFIDTPGHAAFTEMRARGAKVTDIVILVVAADDGIKPQTIEAIDHAKAAKVPIIVAINKIDKPGVKIENIKTKLAELGLQPEEWGGDYPVVEISAKNNLNIDKLLDTILLVAELHELKANPNTLASGTVIEAKVEKGLGVVATLIIDNGTLKLGDCLVAGDAYGKVKLLKDDTGKAVKKAIPAQPINLVGLQEMPKAGDIFKVFSDEKEAKATAQNRHDRAGECAKQTNSLENLFTSQGDKKVLNIILKSDVQGSIEAIKSLLAGLETEEFKVEFIREDVGVISEKDIVLAETAQAIIIGFNVRPTANIRSLAQERGVEIKQYSVIYHIEEDIINLLAGKTSKEQVEVIIGEARVQELFKVPKIGVVAGILVTSGLAKRNGYGRILRDGTVVYQNKIASLKHLKDDKKELKQGLEGGVMICNFNDYKVDDIIEFYEMKEEE